MRNHNTSIPNLLYFLEKFQILGDLLGDAMEQDLGLWPTGRQGIAGQALFPIHAAMSPLCPCESFFSRFILLRCLRYHRDVDALKPKN